MGQSNLAMRPRPESKLSIRFVRVLQSLCINIGGQLGFQELSTKAGRQSTLGYTHGSSLSVDGAQTTNSMVTQDTDKLFIQVRPPSWRNTYVLRLVVLDCVERL